MLKHVHGLECNGKRFGGADDGSDPGLNAGDLIIGAREGEEEVDVGHPARVPPVVLPPNRLRTETPQVPHTCAQRDTAADVHVRTDPDTSALRAGAHTHHTHARAYTHARTRTCPRTLQHLYGTPHVLRRHDAHPDLARVFARVLVVVRRRRPL